MQKITNACEHHLRDGIGSSSIAFVRAADLLSVMYIINIVHVSIMLKPTWNWQVDAIR